MRSGPLNVSSLARILKLERTTLVRNLKALEAAGLIEDVATSDPRERLIAISQSGREAVEAASPYWREVQRQLNEHLGAEQLEQLKSITIALEKLSGEV